MEMVNGEANITNLLGETIAVTNCSGMIFLGNVELPTCSVTMELGQGVKRLDACHCRIQSI